MKKSILSVGMIGIGGLAAALAAEPSSASSVRHASTAPLPPTEISSAQRMTAAPQRSIGHATGRMAPMHAMPRAQVLNAPRYHGARGHVPRVHAPRVYAPGGFVQRPMASPMAQPTVRPTAEPVVRPTAEPIMHPAHPVRVGHAGANPRIIQVPKRAPGVPQPQLGKGTPVPTARTVPAPNFPAARAGAHDSSQQTVARHDGAGRSNWRPGRGPVTGVVGVGHRNVAIARGQRFVRHNGRWRRVVAVTALTGAVAVVVVGGVNYYADGYVSLAGPACGGVTDAGCQLSLADVPAGDGETVPQCVQYCPWDGAPGQALASTAPAVVEPVTRVPAEPATPATTEPPRETPPAVIAATAPAEVETAPSEDAKNYSISVQSAPDAGGKCIDVPDRQLVPGTTLQVWTCNGSSAQTFAYDTAKKNLAIGPLCVDTGTQPGDALRLAPCSGAASQTWYIRQNGDYVEFVNAEDRCLDVKDAATEDGTPLIAWPCHGQANQSWTMHPGAQAAAAK